VRIKDVYRRLADLLSKAGCWQQGEAKIALVCCSRLGHGMQKPLLPL